MQAIIYAGAARNRLRHGLCGVRGEGGRGTLDRQHEHRRPPPWPFANVVVHADVLVPEHVDGRGKLDPQGTHELHSTSATPRTPASRNSSTTCRRNRVIDQIPLPYIVH